jgi:two-component system nitrate/nitrite response regulator NarL
MDIQLNLVIGSRIYLEGLANYFNANSSIEIVNQFKSSTQAIRTLEQCPADVTIIDGNDHDVLTLVQKIKVIHPVMKTILLVLSNETSFPAQYITLGIEGIIMNSDGMADLKHCIEAVHSGHLCYPQEISTLLRGHVSRGVSPFNHSLYRELPLLTHRQTIVMKLIANGFSNKEIARKLNIELSTTKNHVHQILERMQVKSRTEAVAKYNTYNSQLNSMN